MSDKKKDEKIYKPLEWQAKLNNDYEDARSKAKKRDLKSQKEEAAAEKKVETDAKDTEAKAPKVVKVKKVKKAKKSK